MREGGPTTKVQVLLEQRAFYVTKVHSIPEQLQDRYKINKQGDVQVGWGGIEDECLSEAWSVVQMLCLQNEIGRTDDID